MSILDKLNSLYSNYTSKDIKVKAAESFVNTYTGVPSNFQEVPDSKDFSLPEEKEDFQVNYFQLGLEYLKQKKYKESVNAFESELEEKPRNIKARLQLGLAYMGLEEYTNAINEFKEVLFSSPDNLEAKFNLYSAYLKTDRGEIAIKELLALSKANPENEKIKKKLSNAYYVEANKYRKNQDFEIAVDYYTKSLKTDKTNPVIYHALGICYKDMGDYDRTFENLENAIKFYGENPKYKSKKSSILTLFAEIKLNSGDINSAIDYYNHAIKTDPENSQPYFDLAELYFKKQEYELAIKKYVAVIKINPEFIQAYINLGQAYAMVNNLEKATLAYNKVLEIEPDNSTAKSNLALITFKEGKKDLAFSQLMKLAEGESNENALVHKYLGIMLLEKGKIDDAIERFMKSIDINPTDADTFVNLGVCFHKMNNLKRAVKDYRKAVELDPRNLVALKNLALLYYDSEQIREAVEIYEMVMKLEPNSKTVYKTLAHAYRRIGEIEKAIDMYKKHLENSPEDPEALLNVAVSYFEKERLIKAIEIFNNLSKVDKSYTNMCNFYLSKIYQKNGQITKALDFIRKMVHSDIHNVEGFIQYGKVALELGRIEKAIDCFRRAYKLDPSNKQAKILMDGAKRRYEDEYGYSYDY